MFVLLSVKNCLLVPNQEAIAIIFISAGSMENI